MVQKNRFPTISVVTPTFNSSLTISSLLSSIRNQNYPQNKIEIIIVDGGSVDETKKLVSKFNVKWLNVDPKKQNVEFNKSIGIKKAKGELLFMLDHDNILPNKQLISKMVQPFIENKEIVGVETLRYHYDPNFPLLDRYFSLFGVNDPFAFYIGKADRMSFMYDTYAKKYNPKDKGEYFLVSFEKDNIPTIGANGFMVRRKVLLDNADLRPGRYFPIDVNVDLINKGFNNYAFVKDSITHLSGRGGVLNYLKRRMLFLRQYHLSEKNILMQKERRYSLYEKKDFWKLVLFILISITVLFPMIDSLRGYLKIRDIAWFLNPFMCIGFVFIYGYVILRYKLEHLFK